ncbi:hypothetical protein [Microvirga terricola]|uniref:Uncharacterized protein n=1 Tax=Microvirga terricola TaxID=2719797 RepID=A0ABX0V6F2_9HYPH|nr:hypothetical protein [Microvirga terricola]NIX75413.1 hypothetical protein [Microvirga terricola]
MIEPLQLLTIDGALAVAERIAAGGRHAATTASVIEILSIATLLTNLCAADLNDPSTSKDDDNATA